MLFRPPNQLPAKSCLPRPDPHPLRRRGCALNSAVRHHLSTTPEVARSELLEYSAAFELLPDRLFTTAFPLLARNVRECALVGTDVPHDFGTGVDPERPDGIARHVPELARDRLQPVFCALRRELLGLDLQLLPRFLKRDRFTPPRFDEIERSHAFASSPDREREGLIHVWPSTDERIIDTRCICRDRVRRSFGMPQRVEVVVRNHSPIFCVSDDNVRSMDVIRFDQPVRAQPKRVEDVLV